VRVRAAATKGDIAGGDGSHMLNTSEWREAVKRIVSDFFCDGSGELPLPFVATATKPIIRVA